MLNALTIDLEDWYHPELVRQRLPASSSQAGETSRGSGVQIEQSTQLLLDLLRGCKTKATFFVVGEIAQHHPQLVEAILAQGHELACHGMSHRPLWEMTADELRSELQKFTATISADYRPF